MRVLLLPLLVIALALAHGQETPAPTPNLPTPTPRVVRLHFVPPPLEGTISLGIYNSDGKLVRVLHREDGVSDFTAGHDALETTWDGNDDAGRPLPPDRYRARGYLVGGLKVEGVNSFFNDWVTDEDSPHLAHISRIAASDGSLCLETTMPGGRSAQFLFEPATGKLRPSDRVAPEPFEPPDGATFADARIDPIAFTRGKAGTLWVISRLNKGAPQVEIVQLSAPGQPGPPVLRTLSVPTEDPQPTGIAASPNEDRIYLLEESPAVQRVRSLTLLANAAVPEKGQAVSDWKIDFAKEIVAHKDFAIENSRPVAAPNDSPAAPATIMQKLRPNPLERDQPGKIVLAIGFDAEGSYLETTDGLPLRTISETHNLSRALIARQAENTVDVFQDDGAVVEQFRVTHLEEMMAFDCGDFELK